MTALQALRHRMAELADLASIGHLAGWDQRTMMPPGGAAGRAYQFATLERLIHDRAAGDEIGAWLDELESADGALEQPDRDLVRLARRDWDRRRRVPPDLVAEIAAASAEGQSVWQIARAENDFAAYVPVLERNVGLARRYADCFPEAGSRYDALLADYDYGLTSARLREVFSRLGAELAPLAAEAAQRPAPEAIDLPVDVQQRAVRSILRRVGMDERTWRLDESAHPFSTFIGQGDVRVTTRYSDGGLESILAGLHEFGHGLYERQIAPELARTNLATGTSMSVHESQSKLWENHVGGHPAFAPVIAGALDAAGHPVDAGLIRRTIAHVRPSLIRVAADQVTYPLHIVLRFELELALIDGELAIADLPEAWNDGMRRLVGIDVPDHASGVLQDVHWAACAFGYFPSYALGCVIAAQLWEQLESDIGPQADALGAGDVSAVSAWLGDRVHRWGRRLDTEPLLESATGRALDVDPFVRHVKRLVAQG